MQVEASALLDIFHVATPSLAAVGLLVIIVGWKKIKSWLMNGESEEKTYRRQGDEVLAEFLKLYKEQTTFQQKMVDMQEKFWENLSKQTEILSEGIELQKDNTRDLREIYRKFTEWKNH